MLINPTRYSLSVINGIKLFVVNVFPTLFPFMLFSKLLQELGFSNDVAKRTYRISPKIFHTGSYSGYVYIMSLLCGYPVSSKIIYDLYGENKLQKNEILAVSSFTSCSNPIFIIGSIGGLMLKNAGFALIILLCHYASSILNGIIFSTLKLKKPICEKPVFLTDRNIEIDKTMQSAIFSILAVGGYICLFNLISDVLIDYRIIEFAANIFGKIFTLIHISPKLAYGNLLAFIEVTRGAKELCFASCDYLYLLPFLCSAVSFGGLSINMQSFSYLQKCGVTFGKFFLTKISQAIIAFCLCFIVCSIYFR